MYTTNGTWDVKGHCTAALNENDAADWIFEDGKYILHLFAEGSTTAPTMAPISPLVTKSEVSASASSELPSETKTYTPVQKNFIAQLGIEQEYMECKEHGLWYAYSKYKEFVHIHQIWTAHANANTWFGGGKVEDLMEIFASTSYFYSHYKLFDHVISFPKVVQWLTEADDCPDDEDVWGFEMQLYTFDSLKKFLREQGVGIKNKKKDKGKQKEVSVDSVVHEKNQTKKVKERKKGGEEMAEGSVKEKKKDKAKAGKK